VTLDVWRGSLLAEMEVEAFICGNLRAEEAEGIVRELRRALPAQPLPPARRPVRKVRKVPLGVTRQQFVAASASESNSAVEVYYQIGTDEVQPSRAERETTLAAAARLLTAAHSCSQLFTAPHCCSGPRTVV